MFIESKNKYLCLFLGREIPSKIEYFRYRCMRNVPKRIIAKRDEESKTGGWKECQGRDTFAAGRCVCTLYSFATSNRRRVYTLGKRNQDLLDAWCIVYWTPRPPWALYIFHSIHLVGAWFFFFPPFFIWEFLSVLSIPFHISEIFILFHSNFVEDKSCYRIYLKINLDALKIYSKLIYVISYLERT